MISSSSAHVPVEVFWVAPDGGEKYSQSPESMRSFRNLDEAYSFILLSLDPGCRQHVRILTADRTLMFDDVRETSAVAMQRLARERFGMAQAKMKLPPPRR